MAAWVCREFAFCQFENRIPLVRQIKGFLNLLEDSNSIITNHHFGCYRRLGYLDQNHGPT